MKKLLAILILCNAFAYSEEKWTPATRSSEYIESATGTTFRAYSPGNPHYYMDETGELQKIDFDLIDETRMDDGGTNIDFKAGLPISSGIRQDATRTITIKSDQDWNYPDRQIEWTLTDSRFDGAQVMPAVARAEKVSNLVRKVSEDYAVYNDRRSVRLAQRIPKGVSGFEVTYRLKLTDLTVAGELDSASYVIVDSSASEFSITTFGGEPRYQIGLPKLLNEKWEIVSNRTHHTLRKIGENEYEYKKYSDPELTQKEIDASTWIDAYTTYGSTTDGWVNMRDTSTWALCRSATDGQSFNSTGTSVTFGFSSAYSRWEIVRSFFYFDTSGLTAAQKECVDAFGFYVYAWASGKGNSNCSAFTGTQAATLSVADFDAFSGSAIYTISSWVNSSEYKYFNMLSGYESCLTAAGTTKICLREYEHDVVGTAPTSGEEVGGSIYYADMSGTTTDPYIVINIGAPRVKVKKSLFYYNNIMQRSRR